MAVLKSRVTGPATCSTNSINKRGWISSGPHDLLTFKFLSSSSTITCVTWKCSMAEFVLFSILGILPSIMNTLENCCKRMSVFPTLLNFMESLSLEFESNGATTPLVFSLRLVWDQNAFGLALDCRVISCSNVRLALRKSLLYFKRAASASFRVFASIHDRCFLYLFFIASLVSLFMGIFPFSFHVCLLDVLVQGTNLFLRSSSLDLSEHHSSSHVFNLSFASSVYSCFQFEGLSFASSVYSCFQFEVVRLVLMTL